MSKFLKLKLAFRNHNTYVSVDKIHTIAEATSEGIKHTKITFVGSDCALVEETPEDILKLFDDDKYVELPDGERPPLSFKRSEISCFREKDEMHTYLFLKGDEDAWTISAPIDEVKELLNA